MDIAACPLQSGWCSVSAAADWYQAHGGSAPAAALQEAAVHWLMAALVPTLHHRTADLKERSSDSNYKFFILKHLENVFASNNTFSTAQHQMRVWS